MRDSEALDALLPSSFQKQRIFWFSPLLSQTRARAHTRSSVVDPYARHKHILCNTATHRLVVCCSATGWVSRGTSGHEGRRRGDRSAGVRTASRSSGTDSPLEKEQSHNRPGSDKTVSFLCEDARGRGTRPGAAVPLNSRHTAETQRNCIRPTRKSVMIKRRIVPLLCLLQSSVARMGPWVLSRDPSPSRLFP